MPAPHTGYRYNQTAASRGGNHGPSVRGASRPKPRQAPTPGGTGFTNFHRQVADKRCRRPGVQGNVERSGRHINAASRMVGRGRRRKEVTTTTKWPVIHPNMMPANISKRFAIQPNPASVEIPPRDGRQSRDRCRGRPTDPPSQDEMCLPVCELPATYRGSTFETSSQPTQSLQNVTNQTDSSQPTNVMSTHKKGGYSASNDKRAGTLTTFVQASHEILGHFLKFIKRLGL